MLDFHVVLLIDFVVVFLTLVSFVFSLVVFFVSFVDLTVFVNSITFLFIISGVAFNIFVLNEVVLKFAKVNKHIGK